MKTETLNTSPPLANTPLVSAVDNPKNNEDPFYSLRESLYQKYDAAVVSDVFKQVDSYQVTSLPESEITRIKLFCHYYDMELKVEKEARLATPEVRRVFKRYIRHTRSEITTQLGQLKKPNPLTIDHLDQAKFNFIYLLNALSHLIEKYGEWVSHRALNHYSIAASEVLCGKLPFPEYDTFCEKIDLVFAKEKELYQLINVMPYDSVRKHFDTLVKEIQSLKDPHSLEDLRRELCIKSGNVKHFKPLVEKQAIEKYSQLFKASFDGGRWAENEQELTPMDKSILGNLNDVFFLKSKDSPENSQSVAVFKTQTNRKAVSGAMEALAYDVSLIFGLEEGLVPTKQKNLKGMSGSIQVFQDGISWDQFSLKTIEEQKDLLKKISLKDFLIPCLAATLLGNRDLHSNNFFFVEKENDQYGIVVFDNEFCFQYSNYVLTSYKKYKSDRTASENLSERSYSEEDHEQGSKLNEKTPNPERVNSEKKETLRIRESFLPVRCALLALPQADIPINGETKKWLQDLVKDWPQKFDDFFNYLNSPAGLKKLDQLPHKTLGHYQLKAFKERVEKLIYYIESDKNYSFRELLGLVFPLMPAYLGITKMIYPKHPELWLGAKSAEYLCMKAVKKQLITEEDAQKFLTEVYKKSKK
ncbi:MAG: hypothetical protein S4CHLAM6_16100 [Chlamydiae bacterium]|nr:hypothetical protein [Chlamydiota bacterium]